MKIVVLEPIGVSKEHLAAEAKKHLGGGYTLEQFDKRAATDDELAQRAKDADVLIISNQPLKQEVLERCPKVKHISVAFTGVDHIAMEYCRSKGIVVSNCSGYANVAVAELVFGLVVDLFRHVPEGDATTRRGGTRDGLPGRELRGKTFGVVGAGAIGRQVMELAKAFGCTVVASNRTPKNIDGVMMLPLDELLQRSDIISLHVPLTPETRGMIGAAQLKLMKPTAVLVNTARGPVVDGKALADALNNGLIAGAGLDVFDTEPPLPQDTPLLHAKHAIVTPHIGFATAEAYVKRCITVFENIARWKDGKPQNVMN